MANSPRLQPGDSYLQNCLSPEGTMQRPLLTIVRLFDFDPTRLVRVVSEIGKLTRRLSKALPLPHSAAFGGGVGKWAETGEVRFS